MARNKFALQLIITSAAVVLTSSVYYVLAVPPATPYNPGETLAPNCIPGSANCTVVPPLTNSLTDNVIDSLDIQEGSNNYININTTNGLENISFGNTTTNPSFTFLGNGAVTLMGSLVNSGNYSTPKGADYPTTGVQNNVNLGTTALVRYTGAGAATFTGVAGGADGRIIRLINASSSTLILSNQNAGSTASNRIISGSGGDVTIAPDVTVSLQYDSGVSRWRVLSMPATALSSTVFLQNGSAFGTTANLGTTDANTLNLITAGTTRFNVANGGAGASTLTGSGTTTLTSTGSMALSSAAGSALTVTSGTTGSLTIDSGSTGTVNLGTGNNSKTINIGTGTAGNTINIGTDNTVADTINIGSSLDNVSIASSGLNFTTGGVLTGVVSLDTIATSATGLTFAGAGSIKSTTSSAITIDSGTTGAVNVGTGANAKTVTIGNSIGATAVNINSGTGNINLSAANSATGVVHIGAGGAGTATPDYLALDVKSTSGDPVGGVAGEMYYNTADNKFRCFEGTGWVDCISAAGTSLSNILAAVSANSITNGDFSQTWNWTKTTNGAGITFSDNDTSGGLPATSVIDSIAQSGSNAIPLYIKNYGTGNSFRIDDVASDTTPFLVGPDGEVMIGTDVVATNAKLTVTAPTGIPYAISALGDKNDNLTVGVRNSSATGLATSVFGAAADNFNSGFANNNSVTFGITSSAYSNPSRTIAGADDAFLLALGQDLIIGTGSPVGTGNIQFATGGTSTSNERMRIDKTGHVGINTTTPGAFLDIKDAVATDALHLSGSTSGYVGFKPAAAAGSTTYTLPSADGLNGYALVTNGSGVLSWANSVPVFQRIGTTLSPVTAGDNITTSGTISTSGSGAITAAGLLTGQAGLTVSGAAASINDNSNFNTSINTGTSTGTVTIGNSSAGAVGVTSGAALTLTGGVASSLNTTTGDITLQPAGGATTASVKIGVGGAGSTTPDLLALDVKSSAGDPSGFNGAMYYNANTNKFRCFVNGSWSDCDTTGGTTTLQSAYNSGATITTGSSTDIAFTLTSGNFTASGAGSVNLTPTGASSFTSGGALTLTGGAASTWGTTAGDLTLQAAGAGTTANVKIGTGGAGSTTPDLLTLDVKSTAGDPAGINGAMYYSANLNDFRCYVNGGWQSCGATAASATTLQQAYDSGNTIITSAAFGDFNVTGTEAVNLTPTLASQFTSGGALTLTGGAASTWGTSAGNLTLQAAGAGTTANIQIGAGGAGSTTPDILALDVKSTAGDPAGFEGAMYYNKSAGEFRCFEGVAWQDCDGVTYVTLQRAYDQGPTVTTAGGTPISFVLSSGNFNVSGAGTVSLNSTVNMPALTASKAVFTDASKNLTTSGTVSIAQGGTGQTTQSAAFDALAPTNTKGDLIVYDTTGNLRLPVGINGQLLTADSSTSSGLKWANLTIPADSLDFTEFKDAMTLDASTSIAFGASNFNLTFNNNGTGNEIHNLSSTGDFVIEDSGTPMATFADDGTISLGQAGAGRTIQIGAGNTAPSATPDKLVLESGTANPTGAIGGMYYNSSTNQFMCYEGSTPSWVVCGTNAPSTTSLNDAYTNGSSITTASNTPITFNLTSGGFTVNGPGTVSLSSTTISGSNTFTTGTGTTTINSGTTTLAANSAVLDMTGTGALGLNTVTNRAITTGTGLLTASGDVAINGSLTTGGNFATPKGTDYATTGTQNDVNFGTGTLFRYTGAGTATFTGFAGGTDGRWLRIMNVSSSDVIFTNEDSASLAANRIITSTGGNLTLPSTVTITFQYDSGASRWRVVVLPATRGTLHDVVFLQGGNAFGTTATLGTTDANALNIITAGNNRFTFDASASTLTGTGATTLTSTGSLAISSAAGNGLSITSGTTGALTIDSGSTGALNIGTNANAKTITIGNATGATAVNINSGTGNINLQAAGTGTTGIVQIGSTTATATPDLLVLDNGNATATTNEATMTTNGSMYYNSSAGKFRCRENGAWKDCDTSGLNNIKTANSAPSPVTSITVAIASYLNVTITPSNTTRDIWLTADLALNNNSNNATVTMSLWRGSTCASPSVQVGTNVSQQVIKNAVSSAEITGNFIDSPAASTATTYQLCLSSTAAITSPAGGISAMQITAAEVKLGADLAEVYNSTQGAIEPGTLVSTDGSIDAGVKSSSKAYDPGVLGVISTRPGMVLGEKANSQGTPVMLALSGRIPVKVSAENGKIKAGDYLTASSTPGVAMRASKSGIVIGQAISSFDGNGVGQVLTFIKNTYYNGESDEVFASNDVLGTLASRATQIAATTSTTSPSSSNISTDRIAAGLEVVTPSVVAQKISADQISPSTDADLSINLKDGKLMKILNAGGEQEVSFDGSGNAAFVGTLTAKKVSIMELDAPIIVTLTDGLTALTARVAALENSNQDILAQLNSMNASIASLQSAVTALQSAGAKALPVDGLTLSNVTANGLVVNGSLVINADTEFFGTPYFTTDTAGFATIKSGADRVEVTFDREYIAQPIVNASISVNDDASNTNYDSVIQTILQRGYTYVIGKKSTKGFTIYLNKSAMEDVPFSWTALAVKNAKEFTSIDPTVPLAPVITTAPTDTTTTTAPTDTTSTAATTDTTTTTAPTDTTTTTAATTDTTTTTAPTDTTTTTATTDTTTTTAPTDTTMTTAPTDTTTTTSTTTSSISTTDTTSSTTSTTDTTTSTAPATSSTSTTNTTTTTAPADTTAPTTSTTDTTTSTASTTSPTTTTDSTTATAPATSSTSSADTTTSTTSSTSAVGTSTATTAPAL